MTLLEPDDLSVTNPAAPVRAAQTAHGVSVGADETLFAAEVTRLPARLGMSINLDGFLAWRCYAVARRLWRVAARTAE